MSYTMLIDSARFPMTHLNECNVTLRALGMQLDCLLRLPDEILLEIVCLVDRKRDLLNLALTCRKLEDITVQRLYERVDIQLPIWKSIQMAPWSRRSTFRPHVFRSMQELTIRCGAIEAADTIHLRSREHAGSLSQYISDVLEKVPQYQLRSFALLSQNSLTTEMVNLLATRQAHCLRDLRFGWAELDKSPLLHLPRNLQTIHCRCVQSGQALARLIEANQETLEFLHVGQEKELVENYRRNRMGFLDHIGQFQVSLGKFSDFGRLCGLRRLSLVGLDLEPFLPPNIESGSFLWRLEALAIESCVGGIQFLDALTSTFQYIQNPPLSSDTRTSPALTSFTFRHEALSGHLKDSLLQFLASFVGLKRLALLFENATLVERPSTFIAAHGRSLETLVIETRIQPRENLGLDTSRPLGIGGYSHQLWQDSVDDVCNLCPNLVELGIAFPWDDEMVRLRKTKLATLKHLKTIHIRNFPQSQVLSQIGDYAIQEYARRFVEFCFPPLVGSSRPGLETLAIGPTLYESRWKFSSTLSTSSQSSNSFRRCFNTPEYLRSHYFCLDWAKTRFRRWNAMITPVSERYMEELRDERPLEGVFEHVWLR